MIRKMKLRNLRLNETYDTKIRGHIKEKSKKLLRPWVQGGKYLVEKFHVQVHSATYLSEYKGLTLRPQCNTQNARFQYPFPEP